MSIIGDGIMLGAGGVSASIFVTGLNQTDTVTASKDGKTVVGKQKSVPNPSFHSLPDGYTELEYIESTGVQFFNTGIKANSNVDVEIDYFDFVSIGSENVLFGANNGSWAAQLGLNNSTLNGTVYAYYNYDGRTNTEIKSACKYRLAAGVLYADDVKIYEGSYSAFSYGYNIFLLAQNWAGTTKNYSKLKLKSFKMWESKVLIRDFIPAKRNSDDVVGLYDLVNDVFYTNAGSGTFAAGAEVPQTIDGFEIAPIKSYGTWTVSNADSTKTADVLIDAAVGFEVTL